MGRQFETRWKVRHYELDSYGHVNNSVYLNYAEQIAVDHTESLAIGRAYCESIGGTWVVRKHEITYREPAVYGDEIVATTIADSFKGATGTRKTTLARGRDGIVLAEVVTEWVWLKITGGNARPARVPPEFIEKLSD